MQRVLFVDDDADLREVMKIAVESTGTHQCLSVASLGEVQERRDEVMACAMAILDINLGSDSASGLHVFGWLRLNGFKGQIVFLTGHGQDDNRVAQAAKLLRAKVYTKPISVGKLRELLAESGSAP